MPSLPWGLHWCPNTVEAASLLRRARDAGRAQRDAGTLAAGTPREDWGRCGGALPSEASQGQGLVQQGPTLPEPPSAPSAGLGAQGSLHGNLRCVGTGSARPGRMSARRDLRVLESLACIRAASWPRPQKARAGDRAGEILRGPDLASAAPVQGGMGLRLRRAGDDWVCGVCCVQRPAHGKRGHRAGQPRDLLGPRGTVSGLEGTGSRGWRTWEGPQCRYGEDTLLSLWDQGCPPKKEGTWC